MVSETIRQAVPDDWAEYTKTSCAVRIDSLIGGTASWFLLTDLRRYRDDELRDAGWEHSSDR